MMRLEVAVGAKNHLWYSSSAGKPWGVSGPNPSPASDPHHSNSVAVHGGEHTVLRRWYHASSYARTLAPPRGTPHRTSPTYLLEAAQ